MNTRRNGTLFSVLTLTALSLTLAKAQAPAFNVIDLGAENGYSEAFAIGGSGKVAGHWYTRTGIWSAGWWNNGVATALGTLPGGTISIARGIDPNGYIVGTSNTYGNLSRACLYWGGRVTDLGTLGGGNSYANSISGWSIIVGGAQNSRNEWHAVRWATNGTRTDLGTLGGAWSGANDINSRTEVAGWSHTRSGPTHATLWSNGGIFDLGTLGGLQSEAHGICGNDGIFPRILPTPTRVVGWSDTGLNHFTPLSRGPVRRAFLWTNQRMSSLGTPYPNPTFVSGGYRYFLYPDPETRRNLMCYGVDTYAVKVNRNGHAVGYSQLHTQLGYRQRALFFDGTRTYDLNTLIPANSGWVLLNAWGMNDRGQIVGRGMINGQTHAFVMTPR